MNTIKSFTHLLGVTYDRPTGAFVVAEDVYIRLVQELGQRTQNTPEPPPGGFQIPSLMGAQVLVSKVLPPGTVYQIPNTKMDWMPGNVSQGLAEPLKPLAQSMHAFHRAMPDVSASVSFLTQDLVPGEKLPPLTGPFAEIDFIEADTGKAFSKDGTLLLTLEVGGAFTLSQAYGIRIVSQDGSLEAHVEGDMLFVTESHNETNASKPAKLLAPNTRF